MFRAFVWMVGITAHHEFGIVPPLLLLPVLVSLSHQCRMQHPCVHNKLKERRCGWSMLAMGFWIRWRKVHSILSLLRVLIINWYWILSNFIICWDDPMTFVFYSIHVLNYLINIVGTSLLREHLPYCIIHSVGGCNSGVLGTVPELWDRDHHQWSTPKLSPQKFGLSLPSASSIHKSIFCPDRSACFGHFPEMQSHNTWPSEPSFFRGQEHFQGVSML